MNRFLFMFLMVLLYSHLEAKEFKTDYKEWAVKVADSDIKRNPELWMVDFSEKPEWNYTHGLIAKAMMQLFYTTNDLRYYEYVKKYADDFIDDNGDIKTYVLTEYSLDKINAGNLLFDMFSITGNPKYSYAIKLLRSQFYRHPRVKDGAFWHKKIYPYQIWLDGLYMSAPFYTRYAAIFDQPMVLFDDVITQFRVADKYTLHEKNGLNYHAWDESRLEQWADPKTGQSPNLWSRSIGWYVMALVDVLEYLPINHPDRPYLVRILNRVSSGLVKYQDKKTGMWFQVTNLPNKKGNYLESSGTAMFSYAMAKGVNKGYLPVKFRKTAEKAFNGLIKYSTELNADSTISITRACGVAGLGGNPYRDGSFQYYINEPVRNDDPKVVGPFILAAIELAAKK